MIDSRAVLDGPHPDPDAVVPYADGPDAVMDVWHAEHAAGTVVVLVHGGFWRPEVDRLHTRRMARALRDAGHDVASVEYRRVPGSPDLSPDDVHTALGAVQEVFGSRPSVLVGHSAGGHLALCLAHREQGPANLRSVIALAPVADLDLADRTHLGDGAVGRYLGGLARHRPDLDPCRLATPSVPVQVLHGTEDASVPLEVSESYLRAHGSTTSLTRLRGCDHFGVVDPRSPHFDAVRSAVASASA